MDEIKNNLKYIISVIISDTPINYCGDTAVYSLSPNNKLIGVSQGDYLYNSKQEAENELKNWITSDEYKELKNKNKGKYIVTDIFDVDESCFCTPFSKYGIS